MSITGRTNLGPASAPFAEEYWRSFRVHAFTLIHRGAERLHADNNLANAEESDITGELTRAMEELSEASDAPEWIYSLSIHEEVPVHDPAKRGKRRNRFDIRIQGNNVRGPRPRYTFEAKRLSRNKADVSKYLGSEGLRMFLVGEYAREGLEAGMLGYMQSDDSFFWAEKIQKKLKTDAKQLRVVEPWQSAPVLEALPSYTTRHQRKEPLASILIFHLLLDFTG
ncbi:MAG: hypothetical protein R3F37_02345 [Candidatus Competibacteraceae bacterium]